MKPEPGREEILKSPQVAISPERGQTGLEYSEGVQQALRELVERFQICFEVLPDKYVVNKELRQIGFTLELTGTHEQGVEHPLPGCQHCHNVRIALYEIAKRIVPKDRRDMRSTISLNGSFFNSQRMISQYVANAYFPETERPAARASSVGEGKR